MIYKNIIEQINTVLAGVTSVKEVFNHPATNFTKYPAVVFFPTGVSNVYATTTEDFREYRFKLFCIVGTNQTTVQHIFEDVLPKVCDDILASFAENWSMTSINNKRVWLRIESGNWGMDNTDKGLTAFAEFDLLIKLSADV